MKVVVDTNIMFSIMLKRNSKERKVLFSAKGIEFISCNLAIVELFKHRKKILQYSKLDETDVLESLRTILGKIKFYDEDLLSKDSLKKAYELCSLIDVKDTPFVALTIEVNGFLWTGDKKLKNFLGQKGFNKLWLTEIND